jgi:hypothetical protein
VELFAARITKALGKISKNVDIKHVDNVDDFLLCDCFFDIYLIDNKINGIYQATDIFSKIIKCNKNNPRAYIISKYGDFELLKKIWKEGASGFIDKDEIDYEAFANMIKSIYELKNKTEEISKKMEKTFQKTS